MRSLSFAVVIAALGCASTPGPTPLTAASQPGTGSTGEDANTSAQAAAVTPPRPEDGGLAASRRRASELLDAALAAKELEVQGEALEALGASRRSDALEKLSKLLEAERGELRFGAARGLANLGDPAAAEPLGKALKKEKGFAVRKELVLAAGSCRARSLVPELERALTDANEEVQMAAAFALKDLGEPAGTEALARMGHPPRKGELKQGVDRWSRKVLAGTKEGDRVLAAKTLAQVGAPEDVALLTAHLEASDPLLRLWTAAALLRLSRSAARDTSPRSALSPSRSCRWAGNRVDEA